MKQMFLWGGRTIVTETLRRGREPSPRCSAEQAVPVHRGSSRSHGCASNPHGSAHVLFCSVHWWRQKC